MLPHRARVGLDAMAKKGLVFFGLVLWHINHCVLLNAKSFLYIIIKFMISKNIKPITFLNVHELMFFLTVKWLC